MPNSFKLTLLVSQHALAGALSILEADGISLEKLEIFQGPAAKWPQPNSNGHHSAKSRAAKNRHKGPKKTYNLIHEFARKNGLVTLAQARDLIARAGFAPSGISPAMTRATKLGLIHKIDGMTWAPTAQGQVAQGQVAQKGNSNA